MVERGNNDAVHIIGNKQATGEFEEPRTSGGFVTEAAAWIAVQRNQFQVVNITVGRNFPTQQGNLNLIGPSILI